jgi:hypothetical protein
MDNLKQKKSWVSMSQQEKNEWTKVLAVRRQAQAKNEWTRSLSEVGARIERKRRNSRLRLHNVKGI